MLTISAAKARDQFADLVNQVAFGKQRAKVTRRGKDLAAIVSLEDLELLEAIEKRLDLIEFLEAMEQWEDSGKKTVSLDEVYNRLGLSR